MDDKEAVSLPNIVQERPLYRLGDPGLLISRCGVVHLGEDHYWVLQHSFGRPAGGMFNPDELEAYVFQWGKAGTHDAGGVVVIVTKYQRSHSRSSARLI